MQGVLRGDVRVRGVLDVDHVDPVGALSDDPQPARAGRLRIVGKGTNRVDMVHVENAADAHIAAEDALHRGGAACGRSYFITNGEPVVLWDWINGLLGALAEPPVTRRVPLAAAALVGAACESLWSFLSLQGEPPMTRFVAAELAKDHWFRIDAARRDLGYAPRIGMAEGTAALAESLRSEAALAGGPPRRG